jgi:hypothetical protein
MRYTFVLLVLLAACTGDVFPPKENLPDISLLYDKKWNLKSSVRDGISSVHQGEWVLLTRVNTPSYCGPVWNDNFGNSWSVIVDPMAISTPFTEYYIRYLIKDSLVLVSDRNNTYRFSVR